MVLQDLTNLLFPKSHPNPKSRPSPKSNHPKMDIEMWHEQSPRPKARAR